MNKEHPSWLASVGGWLREEFLRRFFSKQRGVGFIAKDTIAFVTGDFMKDAKGGKSGDQVIGGRVAGAGQAREHWPQQPGGR